MRSRDFFVTECSSELSALGASSNQLFIQFGSDAADVVATTQGAAQVFIVPRRFQPLTAQFGPFNLIQPFVNAVLDHTPVRIVITGLSGATADLARISAALGIETALTIFDASVLAPRDGAMHRWTQGLLGCVDYVISGDPTLADVLNHHYPQLKLAQYDALPLKPLHVGAYSQSFGYESYAFGMRDHALLMAMQQALTGHFSECQSVLDVGSGTGVFLECLRRENIPAQGVERNEQSARFAKSLGLKVAVYDALDFLADQRGAFDGIYCSHFVEHLPFVGVDHLVKLVAQALQPGGTAVFVFPDPESIRSQLLGFWRDPEHVRFYHPDILSVLGRAHGLSMVHNSQNIPGRCVGHFSLAPPLELESPEVVQTGSGWWSGLLARMGIVHISEMHRERTLRLQLQKNLEQLWAVNQTWAWEDNATLVFRKPIHG